MELKPGYKQTEVGIIPDDWIVSVLSDLTTEIGDGIHTTPKYVKSSDFFFINGNNLVEGKILVSDNTKCISQEEYQRLKKRLNDKTILLSINGTIGNIAFFDNEKVVLGKSAAYININNLTNKRFVYYQLQNSTTKEFYKNELTGSTINNLSLRSIRNTPIPLPQHDYEQTAIAQALSDTNELINSLDKLISKKHTIKHATMQQLLTGKKRLPGFIDEWSEREFHKVCWFQEGPGLRNWQFTQEGMKVINVTNLENGYLNLDRTERHISFDEFIKMYKHFAIDVNDIVVASSGNSYSKVAVVRQQDLPLLMNTSVIRFKPLWELDYGFLLSFLKSNLFKDQIDLLITGGAQPNFGPFHLRKIRIKIPSSKAEQSAIAQILSDMDSKIEILEKKRDKYKAIKQGMMQELLTGRIRLV